MSQVSHAGDLSLTPTRITPSKRIVAGVAGLAAAVAIAVPLVATGGSDPSPSDDVVPAGSGVARGINPTDSLRLYRDRQAEAAAAAAHR